jgi:hypothetical protein
MKFTTPPSKQSASTLLVVMMIGGVLTLFLGTYLALTSNENQSVMRSLSWNSSLPLAEAGVEEALSHLNVNKFDYAADGWFQNGTNYTKTRVLGDSYYSVTLSGSPGSLVTISATGSAHWMDDQFISRDVQVLVRTLVTYNYPGLVARVLALGGNFHADSYDSSDPLFSTGGAYDPAKASDKALVATTGSGFTLSGSSHIYGSVASGPGGKIITGGAAIIGDQNWNTKGIESGHSTNGFTMSMPDVVVPFQSANAPTNGAVNGTNYTYVLEGGKYMSPNLDAAGSSTTMIVESDSILYVTGNVNLSKIVFAPGAKLDLYLGGSSINFTPALVGATAPQFSIFGLPSCTTMTLSGGMAFNGVIYAPECDLKAAGNSSLAGSIVAKSFTCTGTFDFHYDLGIGISATALPVAILSWNEL